MLYDCISLLEDPQFCLKLICFQWPIRFMELLLQVNASATSPSALHILREILQLLDRLWPCDVMTMPSLLILGQGVVQAMGENAPFLMRLGQTPSMTFNLFCVLDSVMANLCSSEEVVDQEFVDVWRCLRDEVINLHNFPPSWRLDIEGIYETLTCSNNGTILPFRQVKNEYRLPHNYFSMLLPCDALDSDDAVMCRTLQEEGYRHEAYDPEYIPFSMDRSENLGKYTIQQIEVVQHAWLEPEDTEVYAESLARMLRPRATERWEHMSANMFSPQDHEARGLRDYGESPRAHPLSYGRLKLTPTYQSKLSR